jgi:glycosyltransferase involved in cell wall biosynthesis
VDGTNGFVCEPEPAAIAGAINQLARDRRRAASMGDAGHAAAVKVTWEGVIERLTAGN